MTRRAWGAILGFAAMVCLQGCGGGVATSTDLASLAQSQQQKPSLASPPIAREDRSLAPQGYRNSVNHLVERPLQVTDSLGKPAVRGQGSTLRPAPIQDVELKIVWTARQQRGGDYAVPEIHHGKQSPQREFPSENTFIIEGLRAKTFVDVRVSETPYSFLILDGRPSGYFHDREKSVVWHLKGLDNEFRGMRSISTSSKKITFIAEGGDIVEYLIVDFSNREDAPRVQYYVEGGLP
jgi:hypothetical protein